MSRANTVTLVNRTEAPLEYMFNGTIHILDVGENPGVPAAEIEFALTQNIVMGTEDALNPTDFISLVGIKGHKKFDCSPIVFVQEGRVRYALFENGEKVQVGIERMNRANLGEDLQNPVIKRNNIPLRRYEIEGSKLHDAVAGSVGG